MIVDATNLVLGRMASFVAKQALLGEKVDIVNCEKAVITGKKEVVFQKYKDQVERGTPQWGPFLPKMPDRFVRRAIRGMLEYKKTRGKETFKRIMCYSGVPEVFAGKDLQSIASAQLVVKAGLSYMTVGELTNLLKRKPIGREQK